MKLLFIGHNGYGYPHTRVRCYHFARILQQYPHIETAVLSFRDDLAPYKSEAAMYENLRDREKLVLTWKAIRRLLRERNTILYIQKAHFHSAAPYWLYRLGWIKRYLFDYDDYDIPLSNFFYRGTLNRLFFGSNRWDEMTFRLARDAVGCVAASHELQDLLGEHNPHVAYIPTGVDTNMFVPPPHRTESQDIHVLWNGLVWGKPIIKNLLFLVRCFNQASQKNARLRLHIVGGGAAWDDLKKRVQEGFPCLPVSWRDWIDPQSMPALLQEMDMGVLPLAGEDKWLRCKSPTKLFEYMAAGLPVVASAVGEASHVIQHGQSGYLAADAPAFTEGLIALANDDEARRSMRIKARQRAETEYSLPVLGKHLYHFLRSVIPDIEPSEQGNKA